MDERLKIIGGQQLANLTADDIPVVARVLTMLLQGIGSASSYQIGNVSVIHLVTPDTDIHLRAEDWLKIAPYLADGTLNPIVVSEDLPQKTQQRTVPATITSQYPTLYNRISGILGTLFTTKFPTTNI